MSVPFRKLAGLAFLSFSSAESLRPGGKGAAPFYLASWPKPVERASSARAPLSSRAPLAVALEEQELRRPPNDDLGITPPKCPVAVGQRGCEMALVLTPENVVRPIKLPMGLRRLPCVRATTPE
jgi:hypothetical protein